MTIFGPSDFEMWKLNTIRIAYAQGIGQDLGNHRQQSTGNYILTQMESQNAW
jgi:hypothetical protein